MMDMRWRSTRARLHHGTPGGDARELWGRIVASRQAGRSVDLPAADPRPPVSPILLALLAVAIVVWLSTPRDRSAPAPVAAVSSEAEDAAFDWLTTPAYAQSNGVSPLLPIDPPDLSRMVTSRLVFEYMQGADGILTQQDGTDTLRIVHDTVDGVHRVIMIRTDRKGTRYSGFGGTSAIDSLALSGDGRLIFWRLHVLVPRKHLDVTVETTLLADSVRFTTVRNDGIPPKTRVRPGNYEYQVHDVLLAMLPSLRFEPGYARSFSVLDLLGGEKTPGFARSVELRVTGKEWLAVPAGRFHCWVVEYSSVPEPGEKRRSSRLYVDMKSGTLVRAEWGAGDTFSGEQVLVDRRAE